MQALILIRHPSARRRLMRHGPVRGTDAAPRIQSREMRIFRFFENGNSLASALSAKCVQPPCLRSPSRPHKHLPAHDAIVKRSQAKFLTLEERYVDPLQNRLVRSLLDPHCFHQVAPELCELLASTGLKDEAAATLAGEILALLVEERPRPGIERDIRALLQATMIPDHPGLTLAQALKLRTAQRSHPRRALLEKHARQLPYKAGLDWGGALLTHSSWNPQGGEPESIPLALAPLADENGNFRQEMEAGRYEAAFSLDMLHRSPDIDAGLRRLHEGLKPGGKLYAVETVLAGPTAEDAERDRGRTLVHDYFTYSLLRQGRIPVRGSYLCLDEWPKRLAQAGFTRCSMQDLGFNEACPGNREALYIAEKPLSAEHGKQSGSGRMSALEAYHLAMGPYGWGPIL